MNPLIVIFALVVTSLTTGFAQDAAPTGATQPATTAAAPPQWPRTFSKGGNTVTVYQPQIDDWEQHQRIRFRSAIVAVKEGSSEQHVGVVAVQANTTVDDVARMVLMTGLDVAVRFPGTPPDKADALKALVKECLPGLNYLDITLDEVLACLHRGQKAKPVAVSTDPP